MELQEGKNKFIQTWGTLGSSWGINRTMAQVHALLLVSIKPLSAQQIMDDLSISRGNANMNLRALIDWGLVHKVLITGDRKDYFEAEKDMWEVMRRIMAYRKKKELEPAIKVLNDIRSVQGNSEEVQEFKRVVEEFSFYSNKADATLENIIRSDQNWLVSNFLNLIK